MLSSPHGERKNMLFYGKFRANVDARKCVPPNGLEGVLINVAEIWDARPQDGHSWKCPYQSGKERAFLGLFSNVAECHRLKLKTFLPPLQSSETPSSESNPQLHSLPYQAGVKARRAKAEELVVA